MFRKYSAKTYLTINKNFKTFDQSEKIKKVDDELKAIIGDTENCMVHIYTQLAPGDQVLTIKDINLMGATGSKSLEHVKGEVWVIDQWATWREDCQARMQQNCDMLTKRAADWGKSVRIIGLCTEDNDPKTQENLVEEKGWNQVEHYWRNPNTSSGNWVQKSDDAKLIIIDKQGKLVFEGEPEDRSNLEEDLDNLRNDVPLTDVEEEEEVEDASVPYELDSTALAADIATASESIEALIKNEGVNAILTLNVYWIYEPKTGKTTVKYELINMSWGSEEDIDKAKAIINEKDYGTFKVTDKIMDV